MYKIDGFADELLKNVNKREELKTKNNKIKIEILDPSISTVLEKLHEEPNINNTSNIY